MAKVRLLHTSDWHLGKKLFNKDRSAEQEQFLNWIYHELQVKQYDYLLIAGDIFDVPNPPNSALKLFYDFIYKLGKLPNLQTIIIGGNHDSSSQLQIPSKLFADLNCRIYTGLSKNIKDHTFIDEIRGIKIGFKTLPYFKNFELVNHLSEQSLIDEFKDQQTIEKFFQSFFNQWEDSCDFKFLISHHNFGSADMAGSEQAIFLSGIESFPLSWVDEKFDYMALGHIHKKIELSKNPPIIYPGSPIPMRFSESNNKSIVNIEINNKDLKYTIEPVPTFRELIQIKGPKAQVIEKLKNLPSTDPEALIPFVEISVELDEPETGLAESFKKILSKKNYELISFIPIFASISERKNINHNELNELSLPELFKKYYSYKYSEEEIPENLIKNFNSIIEELNHENT